ncbi:hypothetical protein OSTOST_18232, partial [Ostertagia ostertagi]
MPKSLKIYRATVPTYAEDYPKFNLFYYLAKGFRRKPVHHYFRPFWLNVYGSFLHRRNSPKFALNWLTELGHDYMNQVNVADEDFAEFLTEHFDLLK